MLYKSLFLHMCEQLKRFRVGLLNGLAYGLMPGLKGFAINVKFSCS